MMSNVTCALIALSVLSMGSGAAQERTRAGISQIAWLAGGWQEEQGDLIVEERWTMPGGGAMLTVSRTIKGGRMVAFEYLRIVERDGGLVYIAQPNGRPPTEFALTGLRPDSATFENSSHDFPKMIRYTKRRDGAVEVRVSDGAERGQTLLFRRTSN